MYLNLHRFLSPKQSNPKTPTSDSGPFSSLRACFSLTRSQKQKQQKPKAVHWGNITIIQEAEDKHEPVPEPEPDLKPESKPESKPYTHTHKTTGCRHKHTHKPTNCKHNRKPILKPATPLDTITSQASLWELIHETESRIRLNYEYLGITGDVALDAWFRKEEEAIFRRANVVARDGLDRRALAREGVAVPVGVGLNVNVDVPGQDDEDWEFVADVGAKNEGRAKKPKRALGRCLRVSVLRMPVMRARF